MLGSGARQEWPVSIEANHYQLSYFLVQGGSISGPDIVDHLRTVNLEVRDTVWSGWSMFYPFTRPEIEPYIQLVEMDGEEIEVVEANLFGADHTPETVPEFWRVSREGMATIIRPYREDRAGCPDARTEADPRYVVRSVHPGPRTRRISAPFQSVG